MDLPSFKTRLENDVNSFNRYYHNNLVNNVNLPGEMNQEEWYEEFFIWLSIQHPSVDVIIND